MHEKIEVNPNAPPRNAINKYSSSKQNRSSTYHARKQIEVDPNAPPPQRKKKLLSQQTETNHHW